MRDYINNKYIKYKDSILKLACPHPYCKGKGIALNNLDHFKNHAEKVHSVSL